ncbi:MAG TPA: hypothetical protein DCG28_06790 [Lachnospiraceae bacterium]|nr:hypothetical protein [Lachnospiraceae bacterium]
MLIDVKNITLDTVPFSFSEKISVPRDGKLVAADVDFKGEVFKRDNNFIVKGDIKAVLTVNCDLCLKDMEIKMDIPFDEVYSRQNDPESENRPMTEETIDLRQAVIADILLNMPMQAVCSEDCKGLCPKCGHNLNDGECGCDRGYINPDFEGLLSLFGENREV